MGEPKSNTKHKHGSILGIPTGDYYETVIEKDGHRVEGFGHTPERSEKDASKQWSKKK
jgi:hypothetical protein